MSLNQIYAILKARWLVLLSVFLSVVAIAALVSFLMPKKYTSSAQVLIDVKSPDPMIGMVLPAMMTPSYMATQVDLISSERVAIQVIRRLKMNESSAMQKQWREATDGVGSFESWLAGILAKNLTVKPARESNVITISYESTDPQFAAALANGYAESFIDTTAGLRTDPARSFNAIFDGLAARLRERLEEAQTRLAEFQKERGLVATDERLDIENARLLDLSQQVTLLEGVQSESGNREIQAKRAAGSSADVLANQVVGALTADLARLEAKAEELESRFGDAHPQVIETRANIKVLRKRIAEETNKVTSSVGFSNTVNEARLAKARANLEAQRAKVIQMRANRDAASVLVRDVENLQKAYDTAQNRAVQASMESQTTQTNVSIVQVASPSPNPSSPKVLLNMALGIVGGLILALTAVLLVELNDRRVRTADDVLMELNLPLVGVLLKSEDAPSGLLRRKIRPWLLRSPPTAVGGAGGSTL